jgi:perosamine synthetase
MPQTAAPDLAIRGGAPVTSEPVAFMKTGLADADIEAATAVLRSGMLRQATRCAELEARFAEASGAAHALTCANGTCALQLAYEPLMQPGDDVLVPAWSFIATVSMVVARGCRPIFVDADPDTMQFDVADAARRITPKTTAIACTHLYGMPVDIDAVQALAKTSNLKVIYDAAQAHLATYRGKGIGAYGDAVTYSFYATKNLGTGEGGMVTTNDAELAKEMALLRSHGETGKYLHERIGYNYRMNDITAAIGCSKLDRLPAETARRRSAADRYDTIVGDVRGLLPPGRTSGADAVWHLYTVRMELEQFSCARDEFCEALKAEGVPTATHYPRPLTRQPVFAEFAAAAPAAEALSQQVFCLPMHPDLSDRDFEVVDVALRKVARAYRR